MQEDTNYSELVSKLVTPSTDEGTSRRGFLSDTAKVGGSALALSMAGTGTVAASGDGDSGKEKATTRFQNQVFDDNVVVVESVVLPEGGFVAIHDARLLQGKPLESVIGVSELFKPGEYENVEVKLFEGVPGADFEKSKLTKTQPLIAMPHKNTNDAETYDFVSSGGKKDGPYTRAGAPVIDTAFVVVK